ncbi:2-nitropropane dioxygenase, NPD [Salinispora tropica CNB-440]|uniref:2-nitropropane dioxygenase, NPD n=1 Tax=Salinispora tropica (strain ATCC BAA-916 / DSM 44818 / JCM 13857 / NBRC 105044 / CNB-440) TaxID=369723 RepID=A4X5D7_SALTO|nr:2-nitropropane dioxygenase, NPD [Salinispora tropica CNB-440]
MPTVPAEGQVQVEFPIVIQGGMGVGVSSWRLAAAVSAAGQLGVVSGVALDASLARRLQLGDEDGTLRQALSAFPAPEIAQRVLDRYYVAGGIPADKPFRPAPLLSMRPRRHANELAVVANFVEVHLAKQGHSGVVGINYLEKIQLATPAAVYGAMLAGVDYILMGAGLPSEIPSLIDALAHHQPVKLPVAVEGSPAGETHAVAFNPPDLIGQLPPLPRPRFLAIVSAASLVSYLARSPRTCPDGFVLEGSTAGGHSARPRGKMVLDDNGEPVYGERDRIDLAKVAASGLPFWVAGGQADPRQLAAVQAAGATGIQVGTAFALCRESGISPQLRHQLLQRATSGQLAVHNDPAASPTGFPFKIAQLDGTAAEDSVYQARARRCDLGYLRTPYLRPTGQIGFRCPAEPVDDYLRKGGAGEDTTGSRCLCNGLMGTIGLGQRRGGNGTEPPIITIGQDIDVLSELHRRFGDDYAAADVLHYLLTAARSGR